MCEDGPHIYALIVGNTAYMLKAIQPQGRVRGAEGKVVTAKQSGKQDLICSDRRAKSQREIATNLDCDRHKSGSSSATRKAVGIFHDRVEHAGRPFVGHRWGPRG